MPNCLPTKLAASLIQGMQNMFWIQAAGMISQTEQLQDQAVLFIAGIKGGMV